MKLILSTNQQRTPGGLPLNKNDNQTLLSQRQEIWRLRAHFTSAIHNQHKAFKPLETETH